MTTTPTIARRALISVSDKTGLPEFAQALRDLGFSIISTGGTARTIRDAGVECEDASEVTGFPEMMDGRVKTLHPNIHASLLALRNNEDHMGTLRERGIEPIDLVCVNLYPFKETISKPGCTYAEAVEQIDIGGPTMLRSAAKNHRSVYVVTSPLQYTEVIERLRSAGGVIESQFGQRLAAEAYRVTSEYDSAITGYLEEQTAKQAETVVDGS